MPQVKDSTCPKCGQEGRNVGPSQVSIRQEDGTYKRIPHTPLYRCTSGCVHDTMYGGEWEIEWVIDDGQKTIVEPSASEFA